jgi:hypothetical protein
MKELLGRVYLPTQIYTFRVHKSYLNYALLNLFLPEANCRSPIQDICAMPRYDIRAASPPPRYHNAKPSCHTSYSSPRSSAHSANLTLNFL